MARRGPMSAAKRQRETEKRAKRQAKLERRSQRAEAKAQGDRTGAPVLRPDEGARYRT